MSVATVQYACLAIFILALIHTFSTKFFEKLAHRYYKHRGVFHLLGEVEVVFGLWAAVMVIFLGVVEGKGETMLYVDSRSYTEPMFVFAIMVVAGSRPVLELATLTVNRLASLLPLSPQLAYYFCCLMFIPLLGSLITEPAAMTLAAMLLRERFYRQPMSSPLKYFTVGVLFVNISVGGTLTHFAAPPILMVASKWNWDSWYVFSHIGWKAVIACLINALTVSFFYRTEITAIPQAQPSKEPTEATIPLFITLAHVVLIAGIVTFSHHPPIFLGFFLTYMGIAVAYPDFQSKRLILREGLLVAFFLAGLIVIGGKQEWWLSPLLLNMSSSIIYYGATALTAITDNAALTYLGSLVDGLSEEFKYALVSGAVTGGGLTVIANAPNPAGFAILRGQFSDDTIHPLWLLVAALGPTIVAIICFRLL